MFRKALIILLLAIAIVPAFAEGRAGIAIIPDFFWGSRQYAINGPVYPYLDISMELQAEGSNFFGGPYGIDYFISADMPLAGRSGDEWVSVSGNSWGLGFGIGFAYRNYINDFVSLIIGIGGLGSADFDSGINDFSGIILGFYGSVRAAMFVTEHLSVDLGLRFHAPLYAKSFTGDDPQDKLSGGGISPILSLSYWY